MIRWKLRGMECSVSVLFFVALVVMFSMDTTGMPQWCVTASAMHEAGHFLAIYALGYKPASVRVGIFGVCVTQPADAPVGYFGSMLVSLAGPLINIVTFVLIYSAVGMTMPAMVHFVLGFFNLLPIEPLDGGQALYACVCGLAGERAASRAVTIASVCVLAPLATAGFTLLLRSGYNFTLLAVSGYLVLLILLKKRAPLNLKAVRSRVADTI